MGALAAVLNYVPFVGQAFMALILFLVGLGTGGELLGGAAAGGALLRRSTSSRAISSRRTCLGADDDDQPVPDLPVADLLALGLGPVGGLIAVPSLLILLSIVTHILPVRQLAPRKVRRLVTQKARRDVVQVGAEGGAAAEPAKVVDEAGGPPQRQRRSRPARPADAAASALRQPGGRYPNRQP